MRKGLLTVSFRGTRLFFASKSFDGRNGKTTVGSYNQPSIDFVFHGIKSSLKISINLYQMDLKFYVSDGFPNVFIYAC
jgi:hypothetical protein